MAKKSTTDIDKRYGLEPVLEPGDGMEGGALERFVELTCPYCGEGYGVAVDLSAGSQTYIEDCQVCCQPISNTIVVDAGGEFQGLKSERLDC
jgi:hypothetical protein